MKILNYIAITIVTILSLAAGLAKVMGVPQETSFFTALGLPLVFMSAFGLLQVLSGLLIVVPKTRRIGAIAAALLFFVSVMMIVKNGQIGFALISLLPVIVALFVFVRAKK